MFTKENYYDYLDRIKDRVDNYFDRTAILAIHPVDISLSQCFVDMLLLSPQNMDSIKNSILKMIENIYLDNKEYFDEKNKNLDSENKENNLPKNYIESSKIIN